MAYPLTVQVTSHFGDYSRGDQITDATAIQTIYDNGQSKWVVPTSWPAPVATTVTGGAS